MPTPVIVLAVIGLAGIISGVFALRFIARLSLSTGAPPRWRGSRIAAVITGLILGVASWPLTFWMGYPIGTPEGPGRIVGLPFFVAFFDSAGRDYVGPLTLVGCVANGIFWFMAPQLVIAGLGRRWRSGRLVEAA